MCQTTRPFQSVRRVFYYANCPVGVRINAIKPVHTKIVLPFPNSLLFNRRHMSLRALLLLLPVLSEMVAPVGHH